VLYIDGLIGMAASGWISLLSLQQHVRIQLNKSFQLTFSYSQPVSDVGSTPSSHLHASCDGKDSINCGRTATVSISR